MKTTSTSAMRTKARTAPEGPCRPPSEDTNQEEHEHAVAARLAVATTRKEDHETQRAATSRSLGPSGGSLCARSEPCQPRRSEGHRAARRACSLDLGRDR